MNLATLRTMLATTGRAGVRLCVRGALLLSLAAQPLYAVDESVRAAEEARIQVMARVAPLVVSIFDENRSGGGSGVIIAPDGLGLTNFHVVAEMLKTRRGQGGLADGKLYPLHVLGIDPTGDVAMFRLESDQPFSNPPPLGDSDQVQVGAWVFAMGNPFLLAEDYTPTVTHGIVSGTHRYQFGADGRSLVYTDCLQVDASINPGNSGGPLFNMRGELIGINGRASFEQRGRVNVGLGYAISINQIRRFMPALRAGLLVEHGSLGATTVDLGYRRVVFEKMLQPSVASAAGIAIGDRLVGFGGREIHTSNQFANVLGVYPAGWPVEVMFEHEKQMQSRLIRLERLPVNVPEELAMAADVNRAETQRVLNAARHVVGTLGSQPLRWRAEQLETRTGATGSTVVSLTMDGSESADGRGECRLQAAGEPLITFRYNARTATQQVSGSPEAQTTGTRATRLVLWMALREALYAPGAPGDLKRWKHLGGDAIANRTLEMLEYDAPAGRPLRISIDPMTHEPARIMWRPDAAADAKEPPVELELRDYRSVGAARLPHVLRSCVYGDAVLVDTVSAYETGDLP